MALTKDEIRSAAERLDQAEKTRKQIRQISLEHPGITIEDSYAIQKAWVDMKVAQGRIVKGHKIGLTSKGDAERAQYRRAGFRHPARRHVLCRWRAGADRTFHRHPRRGRTGLRDEVAAVRARLHDVRRPQRHRLRGAGAGDPRHPGRAGRSPDQATRKIFDTIADNAANAGIVLGGRPIRPWMPTCAGSARCAIETASWKRRASLPACSIILPPP